MSNITLAPSNELETEWNDPATWTGGVVPGASDSVTLANVAPPLAAPSAVGIGADESESVSQLAIDGAALVLTGSLAVGGGVTLTDGGTLALEGGALGTDVVTVDNSSNVTGSGEIDAAVSLAGTLTVAPDAADDDYTYVSGGVTGTGSLVLGPSTPTGDTEAVLELGGAASTLVRFGSSGGYLVLDHPALFTGAIVATARPFDGGAAGTDSVLLGGISSADVTSFTYGGGAQGGTITVTGDGTTASFTVTGDHSLDDFSLYAGPASNGGNPSVILDIAPAFTAPTLGIVLPDGSSTTRAVVDTGTPTVVGTIPAGAVIGLTADGGTVESAPTSVLGGIPDVARSFDMALTASLPPGVHSIVATAGSAAGSASGDPLDLFVLPVAVSGVSTADASSFQLASFLGSGASLDMTGDTEAVRLTDGTLSVGPDTAEASVQRLYEGLLGRAADAGGLAQFTGLALAGGDAAVASAIIGSPEFAQLHGAPATMSATDLTTLFYRGILGRAPDAGGLASHVAALNAGASPGDLAAGIADSAEAKGHDAADAANLWVPDPTGAIVTELYQTAFGRAPDSGGLAQFTAGLGGGALTVAQVAAALAGSPEFLADHGGQSSDQLVASLYANGLGRAPGAADLQGWSGHSAADILLGVAASPEAASYLVRTV